MADLNLTPARDATSFASSSTFPSHGNTNRYVYEVFINHQGTDVEKGLVNHIYRRLSAYGLRVFVNQHELQQGDNMTAQVEGAIRTASVHVAIFTPTYAESSWCLDELVLMLKSGSTIIPVFYKVEPSDVRWTWGGDRVYARSLGVLENKRTDDSLPRYDSSIIMKWRCALFAASFRDGFVLEACNDDEGQLVDEVVLQVFKKVRRPPLDVARYPTGLEEKVKDVDITVSLQQHSKELFFMRAFPQPHPVIGFDEIVEKFLEVCNGLPLSFKVLRALLRGKYDLRYWNAQLPKTPKILPSDIQSTSKISMHNHLRDLGRDLAENSEYPLRLSRSTDNSLLPFDQPTVRGINTDGYDWLNPREPTDRLLAVPDMSKLQLLRGEGYHVESILRAGQSRVLTWLRWRNCPFPSLPSCITMNNLRVFQITGDSLETLWLHESQAPLQLRELNVDAPLLKVPNSIGKLKHLALRELNIGAPLLKIPKSIEMLKHLGKIVVHGNGYRHAVDLKILPDEFCDLRFLEHLELKECSKLKSLPNSFGKLTNLQHIDLSGCSKLQMLVGSFGNLTGLQHIELSRCFSLKMLPDSLGNLSGLQLIDLSRCSNLHMFPDSLGNLIGLQHINLIGCSNLQLLPDSLGNLKGLQYFNLSQCFNLDILPNSFMNLINLRHIDLSKCSNLEMLPYSFGNLMNLQYINLSGCSNLQMLPNSLGNLKNLQHFDLSWCSSLQKLPNSYGNLINLQHVDLSGCSNLQILPNSFGKLTNLQHIDLSWCSNLPILPNSFGNLIQLKHLCLRKCYDLTISSETLGKICTLEWLEISGCYGIEVLPPQVGHQRFLREMHLFCPFLKELPSDIGELSNLKVLHLASSCLETLPTSFGYLRSLEELGIHFCHQLKCLPDSIRMLTQLRKFTITGMNNLKLLEIEECLRSKLLSKKFAGQIETSTPSKLKGVFPNLQHLDIMDCHHLVQVGALPTTLIKLGLTNCLKLRKIGGLCGLVKLQMLHIERCIEVEDLPRMETLVSLEELRATECVKLKSIKGLTRLKKLRTLDVAGCFELEELEGVEHVSSLERLNVSGCPKFPL